MPEPGDLLKKKKKSDAYIFIHSLDTECYVSGSKNDHLIEDWTYSSTVHLIYSLWFVTLQVCVCEMQINVLKKNL